MLFFSRGPVAGDFNLINSHVRGPTVLVEVTIHYREGEELERTQVCTVGSEMGWGVAFIVRHVFSLSHGDHILVDLRLSRPMRDTTFASTSLLRFRLDITRASSPTCRGFLTKWTTSIQDCRLPILTGSA
jgi:hypothetical protein